MACDRIYMVPAVWRATIATLFHDKTSTNVRRAPSARILRAVKRRKTCSWRQELNCSRYQTNSMYVAVALLAVLPRLLAPGASAS